MWRDHDQTPEGAVQLPEWPEHTYIHTCMHVFMWVQVNTCARKISPQSVPVQTSAFHFFMQGGAKKRNNILILFFLNHLNSWRRKSLSYMVFERTSPDRDLYTFSTNKQKQKNKKK